MIGILIRLHFTLVTVFKASMAQSMFQSMSIPFFFNLLLLNLIDIGMIISLEIALEMGILG